MSLHEDTNSNLSYSIFESSFILVLGSCVRWIWIRYSLEHVIPHVIIMYCLGIVLMVCTLNESLSNTLLGKGITNISHLQGETLVYLFLPVILFESAFNLRYYTIRSEIIQIMMLGTIGVCISTFLIASLVYYIMPERWTFQLCLLLGAILSATDPVSTVAVLRELHVDKKITALIEGESLLNDGFAFAIFMMILEYGEYNMNFTGVILFILQSTVGGLATGWLCGIVIMIMLKRTEYMNEAVVGCIIGSTYLIFWVADNILQVSPVLAVVAFGIYLSKERAVFNKDRNIDRFLFSLSFFTFILTTIVFVFAGIVLVGVTMRSLHHHGRIYFSLLLYYMVIGYVLTIGSRLVMVTILFPYMKLFGYGMHWKDVLIITYGGLRGAITIFLLLITISSPMIDRSIVVEISLFVSGGLLTSTLINGSTFALLLRHLRMNKDMYHSASLVSTLSYFRKKIKCHLNTLRADKYNSGANWHAVSGLIPKLLQIVPIESPVQDNNNIPIKDETKNDDISHNENKNEIQVPIGINFQDFSIEKQVRMRLFRITKAAAYTLGREQHIGYEIVSIIVHAADTATDFGNVTLMWLEIEKYVAPPSWIRFIPIESIHRNLMVKHMTFAFQLLSAYIEACGNALDLICKTLLIDCVGYKEEDCFCVAFHKTNYAFILQEMEDSRHLAMRACTNLQSSYCEIFDVVQTLHAAKNLTTITGRISEELVLSGVLSHSEYNKIEHIMEESLYEIPFLEEFKPSESTIEAALKRMQYRTIFSCEVMEKIYQSPITTFQKGHALESNFLLFTFSGMVSVSKNSSVGVVEEEENELYWIYPGVFVLATLHTILDNIVMKDEKTKNKATKAMQNHNFIAKSSCVKAVEIEQETLDEMLTDPHMIPLLWKQFAAQLMHFFNSEDITMEKARDQAEDSVFINVPNDSIASTNTSCLLICGIAERVPIVGDEQAEIEGNILTKLINEQHDINTVYLPFIAEGKDRRCCSSIPGQRLLSPDTYRFTGDSKVLILLTPYACHPNEKSSSNKHHDDMEIPYWMYLCN